MGQVAEGGGGEAMRKYDRLCAEIEGIEVRLKKLQKDDVGTPQAVIAKVLQYGYGAALMTLRPPVAHSPARSPACPAVVAVVRREQRGGGRAAARFHSAPNWTARRPRRGTPPLC